MNSRESWTRQIEPQLCGVTAARTPCVWLGPPGPPATGLSRTSTSRLPSPWWRCTVSAWSQIARQPLRFEYLGRGRPDVPHCPRIVLHPAHWSRLVIRIWSRRGQRCSGAAGNWSDAADLALLRSMPEHSAVWGTSWRERVCPGRGSSELSPRRSTRSSSCPNPPARVRPPVVGWPAAPVRDHPTSRCWGASRAYEPGS